MPQDYSGQNLRGRSFKRQNLEGANFSGADIRSADFTNSILVGANFTGAKAGLQKRWATFLLIVSFVLSGITGFFGGYLGAMIGCLVYLTTSSNQVISWIILPVLIISFFIIIIRQGLNSSLDKADIFAKAGIGAFAFAFAVVRARAFVFTFLFTGFFAGSVAGTLVFVLSAASIARGDNGTLTEIVIAAKVIASDGGMGLGILAGGIAGGIAGALLHAYFGWQAIKGNEKYLKMRNAAVAFAAVRGTTFHEANLTDANFTRARLKGVDFRNANLTRTCWRNADKLDFTRSEETFLQNIKLRQLLVTGRLGQEKNFDGLYLKYFNLQEADLSGASFIDANLSQANLQKADLSRAILVRTNFERADLSYSCLTGSCIQDWTISRGTKLDGIICDYVYLKWVAGDKCDQMPPRGKFKEGGFVTFVKYILDTVELYHEKDINPRLALTVLKKMARDYDEPLDIVAFGKRGEKVFIQVKVSKHIIQDQFKEDYYSRYDEDLKLWSGNIHQLPPAVNSFIEKRINEIASEGTDDFIFVDVAYVEGNYTEINQGDITMTGDRNIHMGSGNYNERIEGDYVQGDKYTAGDKQSLAEAAAEIQKLLEQLSKSYSTKTTRGKMAIATETINQIDSDPTLAARILSALKAGGVSAFEQFLNHPAASFVIGALEDWQKSKGTQV